MNYCFDRKEVKDHGEGGMIIGYQFGENDTLVFVDDVITSGKALRESMEKIKGICNANVKDMVISVDRMEIGKGGKKSFDIHFVEDASILFAEQDVQIVRHVRYSSRL